MSPLPPAQYWRLKPLQKREPLSFSSHSPRKNCRNFSIVHQAGRENLSPCVLLISLRWMTGAKGDEGRRNTDKFFKNGGSATIKGIGWIHCNPTTALHVDKDTAWQVFLPSLSLPVVLMGGRDDIPTISAWSSPPPPHSALKGLLRKSWKVVGVSTSSEVPPSIHPLWA